MLVVWGPWVARNARTLGAFVPTTTSGGMNAWAGGTGRPIEDAWTLQATEWRRGEVGLDRLFWRRLLDETARGPGAFAARVGAKAVACVAPPKPDHWQWWIVMMWPLAAAAIVFAWVGNPPWRSALALIVLAWVLQNAIAVLTVVNDRYRFPTDWLTVLAGVLGVSALTRRLGTRAGLAAAAALGLGVLGGTALLRAVL
jgi:hypothetical protein